MVTALHHGFSNSPKMRRLADTRRNVFINPDYTKAEARANYEIRQKKTAGENSGYTE